MEAFLDNGNKDIHGDGNPDLSLHRIFGSTVEGLDSQMLLDPLEEEFDLPAALVKFCNGECRQSEVVGQKNNPSFLFGIVETDASELFRKVLLGIESLAGWNVSQAFPIGQLGKGHA